ncbi:autotransporter outer membrane beta-barrel domain-containing protein [Methylomonas sp. EbA]|uniref:Autotransporter outer membrane beta-barrel domain-containing protein n=2 Tax=Methylomonas albis TaxID=1854563 RepID=A0ABR9CYG9_9GAMM|nr:autotransporter outer membrane beta-barrel domain-containing protein [Methylomonas albis]
MNTLEPVETPFGYGLPGYIKLGVTLMGLAGTANANSLEGFLQDTPGINNSQTNMARVIEIACPSGQNESQFQSRCDALVGAALRAEQATSINTSPLQQASPEQIPSQGITATRTSFNAIAGRLGALRAGARGFQVAGFGSGALPINLASLANPLGGAAGDSSGVWDKLGGFVNGNYNTGNVDSSFNQLGYNLNGGSINAGIDYRLSNDLILGAAFTYARAESNFDRNGGSLNSDAYTGALYGTYYATDNLYFDAITSIGAIDYASTRQISYTVPEVVNTQAKATPTGNQYSVSVGSGYNYAVKQWLFNPYVKANYTKLDVDRFSESGGNGWGMAFSDQGVESVTTTVGGQISHAISTSWGVFTPNIRGEWHHQYKDGSRNIAVRFLGDTTSGLSFNTVTNSPDRNYFTVGTGVSGTFARGLSAFLNYDALVGYKDVESHLFTMGARLEF